MKKPVIAFLLSLLLNGIGLAVNYINFNSNKRLLFAITAKDGMIQRGFGWITEHSSVVVDGESYMMHTLTFSLGNLLLFFAAGFVIFYLVLLLMGALKSKKK